MKIDIHSHVLYENGQYDIDYLLADMQDKKIDLRVVSAISGQSPRERNSIINKICSQNESKLIGCAYINPKLETAISDLEEALSYSHIKMIEMNPFEDGYYPDSQSNIREILNICDQRSVPVKVFSGISAYGLPHQWQQVAKGLADLKMIFLHMGCFDYGYSCIDIVSESPNYYVEISNQYEMQILKKAFAKIPIERILFGSTYPERLTSNAIDILDLFNLSEQERDKIYFKNSKQLLGLTI